MLPEPVSNGKNIFSEDNPAKTRGHIQIKPYNLTRTPKSQTKIRYKYNFYSFIYDRFP